MSKLSSIIKNQRELEIRLGDTDSALASAIESHNRLRSRIAMRDKRDRESEAKDAQAELPLDKNWKDEWRKKNAALLMQPGAAGKVIKAN